jgi:hypothetical protein
MKKEVGRGVKSRECRKISTENRMSLEERSKGWCGGAIEERMNLRGNGYRVRGMIMCMEWVMKKGHRRRWD